MLRYLRLYAQLVRFSFGKATAFRFDFWCRILMDIAFYAVEFAFFKIIFLKTGLLGGWNEQQVMIFVGAHFILDALQMILFSANLWALPQSVNSGELDYFLVKPVSTLFLLSFRDFAVSSCVNLLMAVGFFVWALLQYQEPFSFIRLLLFVIFLGNGLFLYYIVRLLFSLPVFWLQSPYGFVRIYYAMQTMMERPDAIFSGPVRLLITTIIPLSLMISFPARVFFEGLSWQIALHVIVVTVGLWCFMQWVWSRCLKTYASASS